MSTRTTYITEIIDGLTCQCAAYLLFEHLLVDPGGSDSGVLSPWTTTRSTLSKGDLRLLRESYLRVELLIMKAERLPNRLANK